MSSMAYIITILVAAGCMGAVFASFFQVERPQRTSRGKLEREKEEEEVCAACLHVTSACLAVV